MRVDRQISRRDLIHWSVLGGATIPMASLLAACGGGSFGPTSSHRSAGTAAGARAGNRAAAFDPTKKWGLQGGFAPVTKGVEAFDLEVT